MREAGHCVRHKDEEALITYIHAFLEDTRVLLYQRTQNGSEGESKLSELVLNQTN